MIHDRLRLDVAVSNGQEIYSWHGENKFSSSRVADLVRTGPISSGGFTGYLHNIFLSPDSQFSYAGKSSSGGVEAYGFSYTVPPAGTQYRVQTSRGMILVPFHGSFTVNASDYQLMSLQVIADDIPTDSSICAAETDMNYKVADISGRPALIPALFILRVEDQDHIFTLSRNEYSQCREFRSESVLHFDVQDAPVESEVTAPGPAEWLPGGINLHIGLRTPIDDQTSYIGDPIEGVLLDSARIPRTDRLLPKNAVLKGTITKFEFRQVPWKHYLLSVQFNRLAYGKNSFLLQALPKTSRRYSERLAGLYGHHLPGFIETDYRNGMFVFTSSHVHLDQRFSDEWITRRPETMDAEETR